MKDSDETKKMKNNQQTWMMRGAIAAALSGAFLVPTVAASAAATPVDAAIAAPRADVWEQAAGFEQGKSRVALTEIEGLVTTALKGDEAQRAGVAGRLVDLVSNAQATTAARAFACRQLARIGSKESVPALAMLLTDAHLSHMARYALQRIPHEEAGKALRESLAKTSGELRIGIVNSLGERRDAAAVPIVDGLLTSADRDTALAIVEMLGKVGNEAAAEVLARLERMRVPGAATTPTDRLADALLRCADALATDGHGKRARELYSLAGREGHHRHVRIAALRGLAFLQPIETAPMVADLLTSKDPLWSGAARELIAEVGNENTTLAYAGLLADTEGEQRLRLIEALEERGDPNAAPEVMALMLTGDHDTIVAAIQALGAIGDDTCVSSLALLASAGSEDARVSLSTMPTPNVDAAIGAALGSEPVSEVRAVLAAALGERRAAGQVPALLKAASEDRFRDVRIAALDSLGVLAGGEDLGKLLGIAAKVEDPAEASCAIDAVVATAGRVPDADARTRRVIAALGSTPAAEGKASLLRVLGRLGGERALIAVSGQLYADGVVGASARAAIAEWPDGAAAETLLGLAKTGRTPAVREAAFRGFVATAGVSGARAPREAVELFRRAFELAENDAEKNLALSGVANLADPAALDLADRFLAGEPTRRRAALVLVTVANAIGDRDQGAARAAIERATGACPDDAEVRRLAGAALDRLERFEDYVTLWHYAGPYREEGADGTAIFSVAFPPEPDGPEGAVEWRDVPAEAIGEPGRIDLNAIASTSNACAYLRTIVVAEKACRARLEIGTDDGVVVWLNGERVHENNVMRALGLGADVVTVLLHEGANVLLLKVTQGGGDWGAAVRLRSEDGRHQDGLHLELPG